MRRISGIKFLKICISYDKCDASPDHFPRKLHVMKKHALEYRIR
jgi:hypothetical protein